MIRDNVPLVAAVSAEITLHKVNVAHNYRKGEVPCGEWSLPMRRFAT